MKILKLYYKRIIKYSLLSFLAVFLFSSIFVCHISTIGLLRIVQESSNDLYHSSGSCHDKKEILVEQNDPKIVFTTSRIYDQNNQRFDLNFDFIVAREVPDLVRQKSPPFSLGKLDNFSANHLSTTVKIE